MPFMATLGQMRQDYNRKTEANSYNSLLEDVGDKGRIPCKWYLFPIFNTLSNQILITGFSCKFSNCIYLIQTVIYSPIYLWIESSGNLFKLTRGSQMTGIPSAILISPHSPLKWTAHGLLDNTESENDKQFVAETGIRDHLDNSFYTWGVQGSENLRSHIQSAVEMEFKLRVLTFISMFFLLHVLSLLN